MRIWSVWIAAVALSAAACSNSSSSPSAPTAPDPPANDDDECCTSAFSWTDDGRSFEASMSFTFDTVGTYVLTGLVCDEGGSFEIVVETIDIARRELYRVADMDIEVRYAESDAADGEEWGAGPFGGNGSLMVTEAFVGGQFYLTGTFSFELVPTSGNAGGGTKPVEGTFRDLLIVYNNMSC